MTINYTFFHELELFSTKRQISIDEASVILCKGKDVLIVEGTITGGIINLFSKCKIELVYGENQEVIKKVNVLVIAGNYRYMAEIPKKVTTSLPCKIRVSTSRKNRMMLDAKVY